MRAPQNKSRGVCCSPIQQQWYRFFAAHRIAADPYGGLALGPGSASPTGSGPSLVEETSLNQYKLSNRSGSRYMFINDVTFCPGNCEAGGGSRCPGYFASLSRAARSFSRVGRS